MTNTHQVNPCFEYGDGQGGKNYAKQTKEAALYDAGRSRQVLGVDGQEFATGKVESTVTFEGNRRIPETAMGAFFVRHRLPPLVMYIKRLLGPACHGYGAKISTSARLHET